MDAQSYYNLALEASRIITESCQTEQKADKLLKLISELIGERWSINLTQPQSQS